MTYVQFLVVAAVCTAVVTQYFYPSRGVTFYLAFIASAEVGDTLTFVVVVFAPLLVAFVSINCLR